MIQQARGTIDNSRSRHEALAQGLQHPATPALKHLLRGVFLGPAAPGRRGPTGPSRRRRRRRFFGTLAGRRGGQAEHRGHLVKGGSTQQHRAKHLGLGVNTPGNDAAHTAPQATRRMAQSLCYFLITIELGEMDRLGSLRSDSSVGVRGRCSNDHGKRDYQYAPVLLQPSQG